MSKFCDNCGNRYVNSDYEDEISAWKQLSAQHEQKIARLRGLIDRINPHVVWQKQRIEELEAYINEEDAQIEAQKKVLERLADAPCCCGNDLCGFCAAKEVLGLS